MTQPHERECAVCTNDFTTPKIVPCGHLLCRECVISWMDSKRDAGCPLCRCPIVEQSGGSSSDTVDALPTDFVMEALVESARVLSKDHLCCVCEDVRADFICMQCQVMMCSACTKVHSKLPVSRSHDVESVSTVTPERLAASRPALCADHGDKQAKYFCREHRLAVCSACKANKHTVCPEINSVDDEIKSVQNSLTDLIKNLVKVEKKLEQAIGQLTSRLKKVDVSEQQDMAQVDKTCDRLHKLVEDVCNKLKEKTRSSHLKIRKSLCDVKTGLSNRLGKVTSHKHIVTRAVAVSPRPALIHMTQALTDRVNSLDLRTELQGEVRVKPLSSVESCQDVVRVIDDELLMLMQKNTESKPPVLVFHDNCGKNIRLTNGNLTAEKIELGTIGDGVVVSRDPMLANVLYEVRVDSVTGGHKELSLGVTNYLDDEIKSIQSSFTQLTKILVEAEQKLEQAIGQVTSRLQEVDVSEQEDMAQVDKTCDRLQKLVEDFRKKLKEKTGTSHLKIRNSLLDVKTDLNNRLGKVTSHKHIVTRTAAVSPRPVLIYMTQALTDRVNRLDLRADLQRDVWVKPLSSVECCKEVVRRIEQELLTCGQQKKEIKVAAQPPVTQLPVFEFHDICGTNIRLKNCNRTAKKKDLNRFGTTVVVSRDIMVTNVLYEVRVDAASAPNNTMSLGVTSIPPAQLELNNYSNYVKDCSIIRDTWIGKQGKLLLKRLGEGLLKLHVGSRVGVLVDSSNDLHLYVDGQDQGAAVASVSLPCFAVFEMERTVIKVTALPTSRRT